MFNYYGSKSKIVHLYPKPKYDLIIEPFAGSARFALRYFDREIILIDKNPLIVAVWHYLQNASEKDILSLPETKNGADLRKFDLTPAERHLIYLCSTGGGAGSTGSVVRPNINGGFNRWDSMRYRIAGQLFKIRHWKIISGDFSESPSRRATWFIDPPYFKGGHKYKFGSRQINFEALKTWIETRTGQIIVCENSSANWMPFTTLKKIQGIRNTNTTEVFWTNEEVEKQAVLF